MIDNNGDGLTWATLLPAYRTHLTRRQSRETVRTRMSYVRRFAADHDVDPLNLTTADLQEWLDTNPWAPATAKSAKASLRSFYKWARLSGLMNTDPSADLAPIKVPERLPRPASEDQLLAGKSHPDPDVELMVRLAANCGLRRSEIARARREDLTPWGLRVLGKGKGRRRWRTRPAVRRSCGTGSAGSLGSR